MFNLHFHIERWKYNSEYELYVSSDGRIKNNKRKPIKPKLNAAGYFYVRLSNGCCKNVHRIVAETYLGKQEGTIDHINGNKRDNSVRNLEWVSEAENVARAQEMKVETDIEKLITALRMKGYTMPSLRNALMELQGDYGDGAIVAATCEEWYDTFAAKYPSRLNGLTKEVAVKRILNAASQHKQYLGYDFVRKSDGTIVGRNMKWR